MKVAKKCGGLPIALDTLGKTLKGKTPRIWKDALKRLQKPSAVNITGMTTDVYDSFRLSYDFIKNDEAKLIFLLCSVFPDDYVIPLESLSMYAMGMRLLNDVDTLEDARNRMETLVDVLKSSSLLLESDNDVKMHDVVRDVAIYISSEDRSQMSTLCCVYEENEWKEKCGSYRAIFASCNGFHNLSQDLKFPKLELLILTGGFEREGLLQIPETFFAGMEEIKVLDISRMYFPKLTTSLRNLLTLCMEHCEFKDIDIIGEFKELEFLRIHDCGIKELPETMSQLTKLKVLNVSAGADRLDVIPPNVISKMMYLKELSLLGFMGWRKLVVYKDKFIQNAKLSEFKYLPHLTFFSLTIPCVNSLSDLSFSDNLKLERFDINISIGKDRSYNKPEKSLRYLGIHSESEIVLNDDVDKILLKRCDVLRLEASVGITNLLFKSNESYGYPDLRYLSLQNNSDMLHLIGDQPRNCGVNYFSSLETLNLQRMESLKNIVHKDIRRPNHFNKLREINVKECKQLKNLFSFLVFEGLSNLHEIEVCGCDLMDGLILMKNEEGNVKTKCSIVSLKFDCVPQLTSFCSKKLTNQHRDNLIPFFDDQVAFPKLESLRFEEASNLKMLWNNNGMISNSFCKLQTIEILDCNNLRYMFPCSAMTRLVSLEVFKIDRCESLEAIFEMEESYIVKENDIALPNLSYVSVDGCPKLKSVFPASISLQQLQTLDIRGACKLFSEDKTLEIAQSNSSPFHEDQIVFPNLTSLVMDYEAMKINSLVTRAESFPKLKILTLLGSDDDDDWISLPLGFRQLLFSTEDLEIKMVSVWKDNTDIWKMFFDHLELPNSIINFNLFPNLKSLSIEQCNGLKNMLNSSVVKRLVNLESMRIAYCRGIISIVDGDGDDEEEEIIFNKLVKVELWFLGRLESFHSGKSKLMFPCLKILSIHGCSKMKIFSNGIISKPKLRYFPHF